MIWWILILTILNVILGVIAVWQRHITYTTLMVKRRERDKVEDKLTSHLRKMCEGTWTI